MPECRYIFDFSVLRLKKRQTKRRARLFFQKKAEIRRKIGTKNATLAVFLICKRRAVCAPMSIYSREYDAFRATLKLPDTQKFD